MTMLYHAIENTMADAINVTYARRMMGRINAIPSNIQRISYIQIGMGKMSIFRRELVVDHRSRVCLRQASCLLCSYNKYYKKGTGCVLCPPCDRGLEFTKNCGYDEAGERTMDAQCKECNLGVTFKDKKSSNSCDSCQLCKNGKIMKKECTITNNTVCECPQG